MAHDLAILADEWFDGERLHRSPATILVDAGLVAAVLPGHQGPRAAEILRTPFAGPGLVECHCHLFLDGVETDGRRREAHLAAGEQAWLATGRANLRRMRACGITAVRDAGDRWGINHRLRAEAAVAAEPLPRVRSPGRALRRKGRYGGFMAEEVETAADIERALAARTDADDLKIVLTGIIDFAAGTVKGAPQFNAEELALLAAGARRLGIPTFAHCSGLDGLRLAVDAGLGSIEHGFFMDQAVLARMAERGVGWTPTWSPVAVMAERPGLIGLDAASVAGLERILANHRRHLALAAQWGVVLLAGSDAGSCGVAHGDALIGELEAMQAAGVPLEACLAAATAAPRRAWKMGAPLLAPGAAADLACWEVSPRESLAALRQATAVVVGGRLWRAEAAVAAAG
ncbi:MAG: amidohydrolase family protein [Planctomycetes bacterium]|nr:amidohydrolase family protein [Planctomycetota bacterium]